MAKKKRTHPRTGPKGGRPAKHVAAVPRPERLKGIRLMRAQGMTTKEIAHQFHVSEGAIKGDIKILSNTEVVLNPETREVMVVQEDYDPNKSADRILKVLEDEFDRAVEGVGMGDLLAKAEMREMSKAFFNGLKARNSGITIQLTNQTANFHQGSTPEDRVHAFYASMCVHHAAAYEKMMDEKPDCDCK